MNRRNFTKNLAALLAVSAISIDQAIANDRLVFELVAKTKRQKINCKHIDIDIEVGRYGYGIKSAEINIETKLNNIDYDAFFNEFHNVNEVGFLVTKDNNKYKGTGYLARCSVDRLGNFNASLQVNGAIIKS